LALSAVISQEVDFFVVWIDVNDLKILIVVKRLSESLFVDMHELVLPLDPL
jgi:hypothetical protein